MTSLRLDSAHCRQYLRKLILEMQCLLLLVKQPTVTNAHHLDLAVRMKEKKDLSRASIAKATLFLVVYICYCCCLCMCVIACMALYTSIYVFFFFSRSLSQFFARDLLPSRPLPWLQLLTEGWQHAAADEGCAACLTVLYGCCCCRPRADCTWECVTCCSSDGQHPVGEADYGSCACGQQHTHSNVTVHCTQSWLVHHHTLDAADLRNCFCKSFQVRQLVFFFYLFTPSCFYSWKLLYGRFCQILKTKYFFFLSLSPRQKVLSERSYMKQSHERQDKRAQTTKLQQTNENIS